MIAAGGMLGDQAYVARDTQPETAVGQVGADLQSNIAKLMNEITAARDRVRNSAQRIDTFVNHMAGIDASAEAEGKVLEAATIFGALDTLHQEISALEVQVNRLEG